MVERMQEPVTSVVLMTGIKTPVIPSGPAMSERTVCRTTTAICSVRQYTVHSRYFRIFLPFFSWAHLCNLDWPLLAAQCWRVWWRTIFGKRARIAPVWPNHRHRQRRHSNLALWDPARSRMPMQGWLPKKPEQMTGRAWGCVFPILQRKGCHRRLRQKNGRWIP